MPNSGDWYRDLEVLEIDSYNSLEYSFGLEYGLHKRISLGLEVPFRSTKIDYISNTSIVDRSGHGLSDLIIGSTVKLIDTGHNTGLDLKLSLVVPTGKYKLLDLDDPNTSSPTGSGKVKFNILQRYWFDLFKDEDGISKWKGLLGTGYFYRGVMNDKRGNDIKEVEEKISADPLFGGLPGNEGYAPIVNLNEGDILEAVLGVTYQASNTIEVGLFSIFTRQLDSKLKLPHVFGEQVTPTTLEESGYSNLALVPFFQYNFSKGFSLKYEPIIILASQAPRMHALLRESGSNFLGSVGAPGSIFHFWRLTYSF